MTRSPELQAALEAELAPFTPGVSVRMRGHERGPVGTVLRILRSGRVRVEWGPPWACSGSHKPHTLTLVEPEAKESSQEKTP